MSYIVNIDTATQTSHLSIAFNGELIDTLYNETQSEHAGFLHAGLQQLLKKNNVLLTDLSAIAITAGPGSYTGLRVGMASAKGLCYALGLPLLALSTLEVMTRAAIDQAEPIDIKKAILFAPMIDARRMEVFTALYNPDLSIFKPPFSLILTPESYGEELTQNQIFFFGNGSDKWNEISHHPNASFLAVSNLAKSMAQLSLNYYQQGDFANLAYSEPLYLKEFQNNPVV